MFFNTVRAIRTNAGLFLLVGTLLSFLSANMSFGFIIAPVYTFILVIFQYCLIRSLLRTQLFRPSVLQGAFGFGVKIFMMGWLAVAIRRSVSALASLCGSQVMLFDSRNMLLLIWSITIALIGTWLPAGIKGHNPSLIAALRRGQHRFLWRAPVLFAVAAAGNLVFLAASSAIETAIGQQVYDDAPPFIEMLPVSVLRAGVYLLVTAFWSVSITSDYRRAEADGLDEDLASVF